MFKKSKTKQAKLPPKPTAVIDGHVIYVVKCGNVSDYSVIIGSDVYEMDDNCHLPNGINMWCGDVEYMGFVDVYDMFERWAVSDPDFTILSSVPNSLTNAIRLRIEEDHGRFDD